jgi:putative FmdB family regulatory protein
MPVYTYRCLDCQRRTDALRTIDTRHDCPMCPTCYGATEKVITPTMVSIFNAYETVAADKETGKRMTIRTKGEHEAFLRRNKYEEVGNDPSMRPVSKEEDAERRKRWADEPTAPMVDLDRLKREGFVQEDLTA